MNIFQDERDVKFMVPHHSPSSDDPTRQVLCLPQIEEFAMKLILIAMMASGLVACAINRATGRQPV